MSNFDSLPATCVSDRATAQPAPSMADEVQAESDAYAQGYQDGLAAEPAHVDDEVIAQLRQVRDVLLREQQFAFVVVIDKALSALESNVKPAAESVGARELYSRLIKLAAALVRHEGFISPFAEDNPTTTPRSILKQAEKQQERLRLWAIETREIADALSAYVRYGKPTHTTELQTCRYCVEGVPKQGEYLHDLTPQLANDETHAFRRCANAPKTADTELQAQRAAEELYQQGCGHVMEVDEITAIILRHFPEPPVSAAKEVSQTEPTHPQETSSGNNPPHAAE